MESKKIFVQDLDLSKITFDSENLLSELDIPTVHKLLEEYYYSDSTVASILEKYHLAILPSKFSQQFPLVDTMIECSYDHQDMYSMLPSRAATNCWDKDIICLKCQHTLYREYDGQFDFSLQCGCSHCREKRNVENQHLSDLIKTNNTQWAPIDYNCISLEEILNIATILQSMNAMQLTDIGPIGQVEYEETTLYAKIINQLTKAKILFVSENSPTGAVVMDEDEMNYHYYPGQVYWQVNVYRENTDDTLLLNILKYPNAGFPLEFGSVEINSIYRQVVLEELDQLVAYQFQDLSLQYEQDSDKDKMESALTRWLMVYNPAQIYSLIWQGVRKADNSRTRGVWGKYKFHQTDFVIKLVDEIIQHKQQQQVAVDEYNYPQQVTENLRTKIFFDEMIMKQGWFKSEVPVVEEDSVSTVSVRCLNSMMTSICSDTKIIKKIVANSKYYSLEKFGIVINDENELYSDQLSLYMNFRSDETDTEWLSNVESEFKITSFYTFEFLSKLQYELEASELPCIPYMY